MDKTNLSFLGKILVRGPMGNIQKPVSVYQLRYQNTAKKRDNTQTTSNKLKEL